MKKIVKRFTVVILSLVMLLSMSVGVFAISENNNEKITVTGLDSNYTNYIDVYKIIDFDYDYTQDAPKNPAYIWNSKVNDWIKNNYSLYIGDDNSVTSNFVQLTDTQIKDFVDALSRAIKDNKINIAPIRSKNDNEETMEFSNLKMGAYLFLVKDSMNVYSPGFAKVFPKYNENNGKWEITGSKIKVDLKKTSPHIEKTASKKQVAIGNDIDYTLTVTLPQYPNNTFKKTLVIEDNLGSGLTLNVDSIKLYKNQNKNENDEISISDTHIEKNSTINYLSLNIKNYEILNNLETLYITYKATVNSTAYKADTLKNTATLTYNTEPYTPNGENRKDNDDEQVYTYGIQITKETDKSASVIGTQFTLKKDSTPEQELKFEYNENGGYYYLSRENNADTKLTVKNSDGKIFIKGLDVGTYILKETKAPDGYVIPSGETKIDIKDETGNIDGEIDSFTVSGPNYKTDSAMIDKTNKNQLNFTIMNYKNDLNLPTTGGMGTMIFTVAGILLMGGAIVLMVMVSKKRKVNE